MKSTNSIPTLTFNHLNQKWYVTFGDHFANWEAFDTSTHGFDDPKQATAVWAKAIAEYYGRTA